MAGCLRYDIVVRGVEAGGYVDGAPSAKGVRAPVSDAVAEGVPARQADDAHASGWPAAIYDVE